MAAIKKVAELHSEATTHAIESYRKSLESASANGVPDFDTEVLFKRNQKMIEFFKVYGPEDGDDSNPIIDHLWEMEKVVGSGPVNYKGLSAKNEELIMSFIECLEGINPKDQNPYAKIRSVINVSIISTLVN